MNYIIIIVLDKQNIVYSFKMVDFKNPCLDLSNPQLSPALAAEKLFKLKMSGELCRK